MQDAGSTVHNGSMISSFADECCLAPPLVWITEAAGLVCINGITLTVNELGS